MSHNLYRIVIEPAKNGFILDIETEDGEQKYVYPTLRATLRELKVVLASVVSDSAKK